MEITVSHGWRHWWVFLLRGILFIVVGVYMIASPAVSFIALGFMFGLIILLAGIAELIHAARNHGSENRVWHLMLGIIDVILGVLLASQVAIGVAVLRIVVGIWFLLKGISLFSFAGISSRPGILIFGGILTVIFALLILFNPVFGSLTIILWTAIAFIITGIFNVLLGLRLKGISR